ncbi:regulator of G-protein signaling 7-like [Watersipora subatra]|uniref:regulator of G-protein signaling 7-like n=1 Tax=Watersipora subatra TaxID=2589382 RepID=UPI00355B7BE1
MSCLPYNSDKMTQLMMMMQEKETGISIRNEKSRFTTNSPSVFTGAEVIKWLIDNLEVADVRECLHIAHHISANGYIFPIDDHILTVKNDSTFYRFQTKCYWQSRCHKVEESHYATYLCKRLLKKKDRLRLAPYEAETLRELQEKFADTWQFIYTRAEIESKLDKKRPKSEQKILESQERAFWDVHYPAPGCMNTTQPDLQKEGRISSPSVVIKGCPRTKQRLGDILLEQKTFLQKQVAKRRQKVSKVSESLISHWKMHSQFDVLASSPESGSVWHKENTDYWDSETPISSIDRYSYKRWEFSVLDLLKDPTGREEFRKFLQKEFSSENLEFWLACRDLKSKPTREVKTTVAEIYVDYLGEGAKNAINVDARVADIVKEKVVTNPSRYTFDSAEEHIFQLMKSDSYPRFLRSDQYKQYVRGMTEKRSFSTKLNLFGAIQLLASPEKEHKQE